MGSSKPTGFAATVGVFTLRPPYDTRVCDAGSGGHLCLLFAFFMYEISDQRAVVNKGYDFKIDFIQGIFILQQLKKPVCFEEPGYFEKEIVVDIMLSL